MKKWVVRWVVDGFVVRENFNSKALATKYYDKIINSMEQLIEIDMWEVK